MKVAVLGGYGPKQSVGAVFRAFQRAGHDVTHVPTLPLLDPSPFHADLLFTFKIGHANIPKGFIKSLKIPLKIFWSFDDPNWVDQGRGLWLAAEHDLVFTSCAASKATYAKKGIGPVYFMPPAMDLEYYRDWREKRETTHFCSFICTNLYEAASFPHQALSRDQMIHNLTFEYGREFHLYGFGHDIERKPACRGMLQWETTLPKVMQETLININEHAINNQNLYFNERFFQITATRRAQFVDRSKGLVEVFGENAFVFYSSLAELEEHIRVYKKKPHLLDMIGQNGFDALRGWTYDAFVEKVVSGRMQPTFLD